MNYLDLTSYEFLQISIIVNFPIINFCLHCLALDGLILSSIIGGFTFIFDLHVRIRFNKIHETSRPEQPGRYDSKNLHNRIYSIKTKHYISKI